MADFDQTDIEIGYFTDNWGPYSFNFPIASAPSANNGILPYGTTIQSVDVKAYEGSVNRKSTLADESEITGLIDTDYTPTIDGGDTIQVKFAYPGTAFKQKKATIIFELTLSSTAQKAFYFQFVRIR
ncbi:MAG: hypothetical protein ACYTEU_06910 [Planctomycetota bacterium]|jgi:uncharacterized surface anchored protein